MTEAGEKWFVGVVCKDEPEYPTGPEYKKSDKTLRAFCKETEKRAIEIFHPRDMPDLHVCLGIAFQELKSKLLGE